MLGTGRAQSWQVWLFVQKSQSSSPTISFPLVVQMGKNLPAVSGDWGLIPGSGRSPGEKNSYPLQYSHLENPMDRGAWWATVYEAAKSRTQLSNEAHVRLKSKMNVQRFTERVARGPHGCGHMRTLKLLTQGLKPRPCSRSSESPPLYGQGSPPHHWI
ncbi:unnamed protein product [Rangifer tarandus platyrhynchus]|uniref:Uncharacterized protein n=1 Tax=Rangifer tarandus platyrhynchus TaxID=3082113 RepID=A0AC59ZR61_RANTA